MVRASWKPAVEQSDITAAIVDVGLRDRPVCVHSSLRSFGRVEGGADAVVDAFLDAGCTVMVPAHAWSAYTVRPEPEQWWERNAAHPAFMPAVSHNSDSRYDPKSTAIDKAMGTIPAAVVRRRGRARGNHALMSFAAAGPLAEELVSVQAPDSVFAPIRALVEHGGSFLLIGVGLERLTMLHYAEQLAGRRPFVRWANGPDGRPSEHEAGGCSNGFGRLWPVIEPLVTVRTVGASRWVSGEAAPALDAAVHAMGTEPALTHCQEVCARCDDAIAGGPSRRVPMP